jgi:hypothetical protein
MEGDEHRPVEIWDRDGDRVVDEIDRGRVARDRRGKSRADATAMLRVSIVSPGR